MSVVDFIGIIKVTTACNNADEKATECAISWDIAKGPETRDIHIRRLQVLKDCVIVLCETMTDKLGFGN